MRTLIKLTFLMLLTSVLHAQNSLFDASYVHKIELIGEDSLRMKLNSDNDRGNRHYRELAIRIDGRFYPAVGVRQKGTLSNSFAWTDKKPLKIKINEFHKDFDHNGVSKFNLANFFEDPSFLRDHASYHVLSTALGLHVPRTAFTEVYFNGEYIGLYLIVEQVNQDFPGNKWDNDGNLYKAKDADFVEGHVEDKFFELKTNKKRNKRDGLERLLSFINEEESGEAFVRLDDLLAVDEVLKAMAFDIYIGNMDGMAFGRGHNFYLYRDADNGQFHYIPWDYNLSFGYENKQLGFDLLNAYNKENVLIQRLSANPFYVAQYNAHLNTIHQYLNSRRFKKWLTTQRERIAPYVERDPEKFYDLTAFEESLTHSRRGDMAIEIPGLLSYLKERAKLYREQAK